MARGRNSTSEKEPQRNVCGATSFEHWRTLVKYMNVEETAGWARNTKPASNLIMARHRVSEQGHFEKSQKCHDAERVIIICEEK